MDEECKNLILLEVDIEETDLIEILIGDYMEAWINKKINPDKLHYMSVANGMLPVYFDIGPVKKFDKIHQEEKPIKLLEQILDFVTKKDEKVLDQFAGSGVLGEAD
ncbi:MAG: site-specific DNA-methyltransferase [Clostridium sp.]|nr:site-specific DNA-methyltransferase [Clostridium sp.]